jgi:hypothetical protein
MVLVGDLRGSLTRSAARRNPALLAGSFVLLACLAVIYATPADSFWLLDCGNRALLAQRLLETGYTELNFDYPGRRVDPDGVAFPMSGGLSIRRGQGYTSRFPPAYAALAAPLLAIFGPAGLRIPAALGVAACTALFIVWLTPAVGRRWATAGGVTLGLATPLFFYGVTVWDHSITVALCLGTWTVLSRLSRRRVLCAGVLIGCACWFREEVGLMGVPLAASCYLRDRRLSVLATLVAGATPPLAGLLVFNWLAYQNPLGPHLAGTGNIGALATVLVLTGVGLVAGHFLLRRIPAGRLAWMMAAALLLGGLVSYAWVEGGNALGPLGHLRIPTTPKELGRQAAAILSGYGASRAEAAALGSTVLAAIGVGALAAWRGFAVGAATLLVLVAGLGSWLFGSARMLPADDRLYQLVLYNGLMIQMPILCMTGIGLVRVWRQPEYAGLRIGVATGLGFLILAVFFALLSQRGIFGVHWGPRYLLPGMPAIVALAVAALGDGERTSRMRRAAGISLVVAGLLSSAHATWFLTQQKLEAERLQDTVLSLPTRVVITYHPFLAEHLAFLWKRKLMLHVGDMETRSHLIRGFREVGVRDFLLMVPEVEPKSQRIGGWQCRLVAQHRGRHLHYFDMDLQLCRRGRALPPRSVIPRNRRQRR